MKSRGKIIIVPLGDLDFFQINKLAANLSVAFSAGVDILQGMELPDEAESDERGQYYANVILSKTELIRQGPSERIFGVTEEDLYIPTARFIYGAANVESGCAVLSFYRLRQEFYGLPEDEKQVYARTLKESIFLLGQLYGLEPCNNPRCPMFQADSMMDTDTKVEHFCDNCLRRFARQRV